MKKHIIIVGVQAVFLVLVLTILYLFYPSANVRINGNAVNFISSNAKIITISESPDFSNPRYIEINKSYSVKLSPGTYYWKASNGFIEGLDSKFSVESEVGLQINEGDKVENIGNVKLNVSKDESGHLVGHVILEPEQYEKIVNATNATFTGRQNE